MASKAQAKWEGTVKGGNGTMKPEHAGEIPFSFGSRFEGQAASNPEELIGAALAGCFSMALSSNLEKAGGTPKSVRTTAAVTLTRGADGLTITAIELAADVSAGGVDAAKVREVAETTKKTCPVSKALAAVGNVTLKVNVA